MKEEEDKILTPGLKKLIRILIYTSYIFDN